MDASTRHSLLTGGSFALDTLTPDELIEWFVAADNTVGSMRQHFTGFRTLRHIEEDWRRQGARDWGLGTVHHGGVETFFESDGWRDERCVPLYGVILAHSVAPPPHHSTFTFGQILRSDHDRNVWPAMWEVRCDITHKKSRTIYRATDSRIYTLTRERLITLFTDSPNIARDMVLGLELLLDKTIEKRRSWLDSLRDCQRDLAAIASRVGPEASN